MIQSPIKTNSQVQNFSLQKKKKKNQFNADGKNPFLSKKNKYTAYTARQPALHKTLTTAKSRIMHTHTHIHLIRILTNPIKPKARTPKYKRGEKRARWTNSIQPRGTTKKEGGREEEGERVRGREETMAEPREAPSTSWSSPSGHKNAGVTRFVMEVLAPSSGRSREKERGEGGRGGGKPSKRVGSSGWRVSTDRIKGVRPTVLWKELYGAEHHPDMQKRAIISVLHFSTECRCIGYVIVGVCGCCV